MLSPITCPDLDTALQVGSHRQQASSALTSLLDVEFWLIGRDVEHPGGNRLVELGFRREPAPTGVPRHSRYRRSSGSTEVVLWSWGLFYSRAGAGLLLTRCEGTAASAMERAPDVYEPQAATSGSLGDPAVIADACAWLATYEDAVATAFGVGHRVPRDGTRPGLAPPAPWSLAVAWRELEAATRRTGAAVPS